MKILFTLLLFLASAVSAQEITYSYPITRVIDGDTVAFAAKFLPKPLKPELHLRIYGVDTPEKGRRSKCLIEDNRGNAATEFTKKQVEAAKEKKIVLMSWDKYGGRVLGDVILDGKSLRKMLIEAGHAREYFGDAKKSWCN